MTPKKLGVSTAALLALALLSAGCGSTDGSAEGTDASNTAETVAATEGAESDRTNRSDTDADLPSSLAAVDRGDDEGQADADDEPPATTGGLPAMDQIESVLDDFTRCLNDEGADVSVLTINDMMARLPTLPVDADEAGVFAHFYERDISDPVVAAAMEACEPILDDPAIAMFLPRD